MESLPIQQAEYVAFWVAGQDASVFHYVWKTSRIVNINVEIVDKLYLEFALS